MKFDISVIIVTVVLMVVAYFVGYAKGHIDGMNDAQELRHQTDCEVDFRFKPASEVTADCEKYFK